MPRRMRKGIVLSSMIVEVREGRPDAAISASLSDQTGGNRTVQKA